MRPGRGPPLVLYGLVAARNGAHLPSPGGLRAEVAGEIAAIVGESVPGRGMARSNRTTAPDVTHHREVVRQIFARCAVVPAPAGVVFRGAPAVQRWLTLHHHTLREAVAYVDGRAEARIHVRPISTRGADGARDVDAARSAAEVLDAIALELFHRLGRDVRAWLPADPTRPSSSVRGGTGAADAGRVGDQGIRVSDRDHPDVSASFLVDRSRWRAFADAVADEGRHHPALEVAVTGPWPPYDFVRLQFGG